ncbi:MAG: site-specific integrase [Acetobacteraceae bacterium]|nr:site-specific integrase [Acetobacteraceae bacterium]
MAKLKLTQAAVDALTPPANGARKYKVSDTAVAGFHVAVFASGTKTYYVRYTDLRGRPRDMTLGKHGVVTAAEARKRALELRAQAALGRDPAEERRRLRTMPTVASFVADRYLPHLRESIRSHAEYADMLRLRILPAFGRMALDEVTFADVAAFKRRLIGEKLSPSRTNRHLAVLRAVFGKALKWGAYTGTNPAASPGMLREEHREVFLDAAQFRALTEALRADRDQVAACAISLLALTGARKSEILEARWEHVDMDRGLLTVPLSKSGSRRHVRLSGVALGILGLLPRTAGQPYVFSSPRCPGKPLEGVRAAWDRCKAAAGLPAGMHLHDLRHTFASLCMADGVSLYEVSKLLGHSNLATTQRYAHLGDKMLLATADRIGSIAMGGAASARLRPAERHRPPRLPPDPERLQSLRRMTVLLPSCRPLAIPDGLRFIHVNQGMAA